MKSKSRISRYAASTLWFVAFSLGITKQLALGNTILLR
jgi:hypothetical protein